MHVSDIYICILYTPNLGSEIAVSVREREQGRLSREHRGSTGGAPGGAGGSKREQYGAVQGRSR